MKNTKRAFTLIELLIVVAIIAILAAIAVPNFLEAQVRSKVARVKSDQRSIATALESYIVDYNRAPLDFTDWSAATGCPLEWRFGCYRQLTTPVAYYTSFPIDPFFQRPNVGGRSFQEMMYFHYEQYAWNKDVWFKPASDNGYKWSLYSVGPWRTDDVPWMPDCLGATAPDNDRYAWIYDSTNGTKSQGRIVRTNKGVLVDYR